MCEEKWPNREKLFDTDLLNSRLLKYSMLARTKVNLVTDVSQRFYFSSLR